MFRGYGREKIFENESRVTEPRVRHSYFPLLSRLLFDFSTSPELFELLALLFFVSPGL